MGDSIYLKTRKAYCQAVSRLSKVKYDHSVNPKPGSFKRLLNQTLEVRRIQQELDKIVNRIYEEQSLI